jgi:hypothetical protein
MTTTTLTSPRLKPFVRHFVEMVIAMVVGMVLLGPVWTTFAAVFGGAGTLARPDVAALVMATNMTIGMSIWMRHRVHGWAGIAEMGAAMYVPFLLLLGPFWTGQLSGEALMMGGHTLMLPAMVGAMLLRRGEYSQDHRHHSAAPGRAPANRIVAVLKHRWPTWLGLVMTVDNWVDPSVPSPWFLLMLPAAYLVIGTARKQFGDRRILALQVAGLLGYLALTLIAVSVDAEQARYLVASGWLAHAVWDLAHHRARAVVPRAYAEWCAVVDGVIGITILFLWQA